LQLAGREAALFSRNFWGRGAMKNQPKGRSLITSLVIMIVHVKVNHRLQCVRIISWTWI